MTKTLTEQWREGTLPQGYYYIIANTEQKHKVVFYLPERNTEDEARLDLKDQFVLEVLAPVPSYDKVKEMSQKIERLEFDNEALEMAHNEGKEINAELVSKTDELVQKIHILNEQNTKQYNELCEQIKKNNILEKRLAIATKALKEYADSSNWYETDDFGISAVDQFACDDYGYNIAEKALKEMEGVK